MGTEGLGPNFWVGTIMMLVSQLSAVVNSKTMQNVSRACGPNLPINQKKSIGNSIWLKTLIYLCREKKF